MRKLIISIFTCTLLCIGTQAQNTSRALNSVTSLTDLQRHVRGSKVLDKDNNGTYSGSPYSNKSFKKGSILMEDGSEFKDLNLRYNNYNDLIEIQVDSGAYEISRSFPAKSITINGFKYVKKQWIENNIISNGYFIVLSSNPVGLFSKKKVILQDAKVAKAYQEAKIASFKQKKIGYYINNQQSNILKKVKRKKDLLSLLSDKQNELNNYIKENRLKTNKQEDLSKIINYYNTL